MDDDLPLLFFLAHTPVQLLCSFHLFFWNAIFSTNVQPPFLYALSFSLLTFDFSE